MEVEDCWGGGGGVVVVVVGDGVGRRGVVVFGVRDALGVRCC